MSGFPMKEADKEALKIQANFCNNVAVGFFLAALVTLGVAGFAHLLNPVQYLITALVCMGLSYVFHRFALGLVKRIR